MHSEHRCSEYLPGDATDAAAVPLNGHSRIVAVIIDRVWPTIVRVDRGADARGGRRSGGIGLGVIVADDGLVLIGNQVVGGTRCGSGALAPEEVGPASR